MDAPNRRQFLTQSALLGAALLARAALAANSPASGDTLPPLAPPDRQPPKLNVPSEPPRKIGWAIVGLGELALGELLPAFGNCRLSRPVALVSGHPEKARRVASAYGIRPESIYDYTTYDRLAENPEVDAIHIVLPNSMHAEFTIRGVKAGKHVLCQKPMAVSVAECEQMISAASAAQRQLGVAYRMHHEPLTLKAAELCRQQAFGPIKLIESSNCQNTAAPNIRLSHALGGGPAGDVGIYSFNTIRLLIGEEPAEVTAFAHQPKDDPRFREVPESIVYTLRYPSGIIAHCDCSFGAAESRRFRVQSKEGFVEMDPAFTYRGLKLRTQQGSPKEGDSRLCEIRLEEVNQFSAEMDHFSECLLQNRPTKTPGELGLADLRILEAIYKSIQSGQTVKL